MRRSSPLLVVFLLLAACAPQTINSASYALAGRSFRGPARALPGLGTPSTRDGLDIEIGKRPFGLGEGVLLVSYEKPIGTPESAYRLALLTYTFNAADSYNSVSYTLDLHGKLTPRRSGGLSGKFYGTLPATTRTQRSTVRGTFKVAPPARGKRPSPEVRARPRP